MKVTILCDADVAGCHRLQGSISGDAIRRGIKLIKGLATSQPIIALTSGEEELSSVVRASLEGLGMLSVLRDMGYEVGIEI